MKTKKAIILHLLLWLPFVLAAQTLMPGTDGAQTSVNISNPITFYDAGGETGNIPTYQVSRITFVPTAGQNIEITFETVDLQGGSIIKIFDGEKKLNEYYDDFDEETIYSMPSGEKTTISGTQTNIVVKSDSPDGKLTVCFQNANGTGSGWKATVKNVAGTPLPDDEVRISTTPTTVSVSDTPLNFYDDGGKNGKISEGFEGQITFVPTTSGNKIKIEFTSVSLFYNSSAVSVGNQDVLNIYNGTTAISANLLETLTTEPKTIKSTSSDGALTVTLKSKTAYPADGFEAIVTEYTPQQMVFESVQLAQFTTGTVAAGDKSQAILSVNIRTNNNSNPITVNSIHFNSNGTFANMEKAILYYTGKNNKFSTSQKIGEVSVNNNEFIINCNVPQALLESDNYFWLAYDIKTNAPNDQVIDAGCTSIALSSGSQAITNSQPEGNRIIKNEYISTIGRFEKTVFGVWTYTHTVASAYSNNYKAEIGDQIITFVPGNANNVIELDFSDFDLYYASSSYGVRSKYQIFNGKGTNGEKLWEVNLENKKTGPTGKIYSTSPDGALTIVFNANTEYSTYTAKGWHATVNEYEAKPMVFKNINAFQTNTEIITPASVQQEIIGIEINTEGGQNPLLLQELTIDLKGAKDKIKKVSIFSTNSDQTFATTTLWAEVSTPTENTVTLVPATPTTLAEGKNFFWIAYDMNDALGADLPIDAALINAKINGIIQTPIVGDPDGERITRNIYNFQNGTNTINVNSTLLFYDNGGADGDYNSDAKGTLRFVPKEGDIIKLVFKSFRTHYSDYLYVYSGESTDTADQLAKISGSKSESNMPADILSLADDGSLTIKFEPTNSNDGWEIEVISYTPQPLAVSNIVTKVLSTEKLLRGAQKEQMLQVAVTVTGDKGNLNFNEFIFATNDEAKPAIENAKLYYSEQTDVFSNNLYGEQSTQAPFTFNGNTQIKKPGTYFFWLTYDIAPNAAIDTEVKATLQNVKEAEMGEIEINESVTANRIIKSGFSGTYTIGESEQSHYKTWRNAIEAMETGIDGKVVFEVESGTYNETVLIPHIAGASAQNTITIKSATGNYNDVIIELNTYSSPSYGEEENGLFTIYGADYFTLEGITIKTNKTTFPSVVNVKKISEYVTINNCFIQAPRSSTYSSGDISLVRVEGANTPYANSDYFTLENSVLDGGYSGAYIYGTGYVALPKQKGARIAGNRFTNQGVMSVYITKEHGGIVENNTIIANGTTGSPYKAIDAVMMGNTIIRNNKISVTDIAENADINAIYLRRRDDNETLESRNRIYNNQVIIVANNGTRAAHGIFNSSPAITNTDIAYNSVNITNDAEKTNTSAVYMTSTLSVKPESVKFENNIFQNNAGGYIYYIKRADALPGISFNNNALYTSGTNFAYSDNDFADFDAWKAVSNEENSIVEQVHFLSANSLDLTEAGNLRAAKPISYVTTDINGTNRHEENPTMGAYEYVPIMMPEIAEGYPQIENIQHNSVTVKLKFTENGKVFILPKKASEAAATLEEVLMGTEKEMLKNEEQSILIDNLESQTEYKLYFVAQSLSGDNSAVIESQPFTTTFEPTQVSTFEEIAVGTETEFIDGTARFNGFKVVEVENNQDANNKQAAQLQSNGTITITNNSNGLVLNGFLLKSDASVELTTKKGETTTNTKTIEVTNGKWIFVNLKNLNEITSVSLSGTGNTLIDNFSGTPEPIAISIQDQTVNQDEAIQIEADIEGGVLPFTYVWQNSNQTTLSEDAILSITAENTAQYTLTVTDAWGNEATSNFVITVIGEGKVATFDDLYLEPESHWWGNNDSMTSTFYSGSYSFSNTFMPEYSSWAGFGYSNRTSTTFDNFLIDQFNSSVGHGVFDSENYAVAYTSGDPTKVAVTNNTEGDIINGFYIANNAWVVSVSENGTGMGDEPNEPFHMGDWYKIIATADNGNTAEFYLADYRSEDASNHYTLQSWQWFDLRSLGQVKHVRFSAEGTRPSQFGSTIPTYFCMDNFGGEREVITKSNQLVNENTTINIALPTLFENLKSENNAIYQITDPSNEEFASVTIVGDELQITGNKVGTTFVIVKQTIKGEAIFIKLPIEVTFATQLNNWSDNQHINIKPNPADDYITVNVAGNIMIYTLSGNLVETVNNYQPNQQINVSSLISGMYILKIENQGIISNHKFIKK